MENNFNVEVCAATNLPCSYCQPVCDHRILCDKCNIIQCGANFKGWCRAALFIVLDEKWCNT